MGEKDKVKEEKPQKDHSLGMIILVGILVIMLGCCFAYIYKLKNVQTTDDAIPGKEYSTKFNFADYKGVWFVNKEQEDADYVEIKEIKDDYLLIDIFYYRARGIYDIKAYMTNNIGRFEAKTDNDEIVKGTVKFGENKVFLKLDESETELLEVGKEKVFTYKRNSTNTEKVEGNSNTDSTKLTDKEALEIGEKLYNTLRKEIYKIYNKDNSSLTNSEKAELYQYMTKDAQKIFEKKTKYYQKNNKNYYDLEDIDVGSAFGATDVGEIKLRVNKIDYNKVSFHVDMYTIQETESQIPLLDKTLKNGFIISKEGKNWKMSYFK